MAKIKGLEERQRGLKQIEDKINEVKEINAFLLAAKAGVDSAKLTLTDAERKKRHSISLNLKNAGIADILNNQKNILIKEIDVLCVTHSIELSEAELDILSADADDEVSEEAYTSEDTSDEGAYTEEETY